MVEIIHRFGLEMRFGRSFETDDGARDRIGLNRDHLRLDVGDRHRFRGGHHVHGRRHRRRGGNLVDRLVPEQQLGRFGYRGDRRALADQLARLGRIVARRSGRPGQCRASLGAEPGRGLHGRRSIAMHRSVGQLVVLRNQTDLNEQVVHCVIGHVHAGERADAP